VGSSLSTPAIIESVAPVRACGSGYELGDGISGSNSGLPIGLSAASSDQAAQAGVHT